MNDDRPLDEPHDDVLADPHETDVDLPGDELGGGLGNADGGEPASDG